MPDNTTTITNEEIDGNIRTTTTIITYQSKDAKVSEILRLRDNAQSTKDQAVIDITGFDEQLTDLGYEI